MAERRRFCTLRLYPTPEQEDLFVRTLGCCRKVWNLSLDRHNLLQGEKDPSFDVNDAMRQMTVWKRDPKYTYLSEAVAQALQQSVRDLGQAFVNRRKRPDHFGMPRFRKRGGAEGFRLPQGWRLDSSSRRLYVPKAGWVRYRGNVHLTGEYKSLTVKRDAMGHWSAFVQVKIEEPEPTLDLHDPVGLDRGVVCLAALSDGTVYPGILALRDLEARIAREQRRLSRKVGSKKGEPKSRNWRKQRKKVARLQAKAAAVRRDTLHKVSANIAKNHGYVAVEDLRVASMTARAHGKGRSAKASLNRAVLDQGWSAFAAMLSYKLADRGGLLVEVPAAYTSQGCSVCGHVDAASRKDRSHFLCTRCGHTENADVNAAKNILRRAGQARIACEVSGERIPPAAGTAKYPQVAA